MKIHETLGGTDTARVEELRRLLQDFYKQRAAIRANHGDIIGLYERVGNHEKANEARAEEIKAVNTARRVIINRFSTVLAEEWEP